MNRFFGGKQKTAPELVKSLRDSLLVLTRNEKEDKKTHKVSGFYICFALFLDNYNLVSVNLCHIGNFQV